MKKQPTKKQDAQQSILVSLDSLTEANYRKAYSEDSLHELAASIRVHGVLEPVLVRPNDSNGYTLVFGHRRCRAARIAGLAQVPAFVRECGDEEARELALIENSQREDPHPLDEADALQALMTEYGRSIAELSAQTGKSVSHIWRRLRLCSLGEACRNAFIDGRLTTGAAEMLATVADLDLQAQALADLTPRWNQEPVTLLSARRYVEERCHLLLANAPFPVADASLDGRPACNGCPKRTGAQPLLFGQPTKKDDRCTDSACYTAKKEAAWTRTLETALEKGHEVLDDEDSFKAFPHGEHLPMNSPFVDLAAKCYSDPKHRTWGAVLGQQGKGLPRVIARDRSGRVHQLVTRDDASIVLKAVAPSVAKAASRSLAAPEDTRKQQAEQRKENAKRSATVDRGLARLVEHVEGNEPTDDVLRLLAEGFFEGSWSDVIRSTVKRRGLTVPKGEQPAIVLHAHLATLTGRQLLAFCLEMVTARCACPGYGTHYGSAFMRALGLLNCDVQELERDAA
ncbi:ParB/RepB/Spo0J family partition protein [Myxococcus vastator]|uniref:ParB/RepB/Spo0J family partition protein n=1 Tax=Myxococcus vastator TaxID=2709664 RepID=UPI0013D650E9|nr:ParB/RepB/Spo0J family partition protein [Myxococcus vastator]